MSRITTIQKKNHNNSTPMDEDESTPSRQALGRDTQNHDFQPVNVNGR
jgi:hypothetical protein